jgi:hypothetical protein
MKISENQFNMVFHLKEYSKYNKLYLIFKYIYLFSPALIFMWFIIPSYWILPIIGFIALISWLCSIKMKSLRDINNYCAKHFKKEYSEELKNIFK